MTIKFLVDQTGPQIGTRTKGEIPDPDLPKAVEDAMVKRGIAERVGGTQPKKKKGVKDDDND